MKTVVIQVNKQDVYDEVSKTTAYTGKKAEAEGAFARAFATEVDQTEMFERFWNEGKINLVGAIKQHVTSENEDNNSDYKVTLSLSNRYDDNITTSLNQSAFTFFVLTICAKWFGLYDHEERDRYVVEANAYLEDIKRKVLYKTKPTRPTY